MNHTFSGMQQTYIDMPDNEIWTTNYSRLDRA